MNFAKNAARFLRNIGVFFLGYTAFKVSKRTPKGAYASMRQLYCQTNGGFNELVSKMETVFRRPYKLEKVSGVLGHLDPSDIRRIADDIRENGYHVFPNRLPAEKVAELVRFSKTEPSIPRLSENKTPLIYRSENPVSPLYDFTPQSIFESPCLQPYLMDESFLAVAQEYLGNAPMLDLVAMWWSTANCKNADLSKSAQLYHFDMDRIRFLKFFIYLSDVDTNNGPHCYIQCSNRVKAPGVRRDGRILDEELHRHYPEDAFKEITGPIGTILAVDTSGFHKGKPLESGERLIFQMEFSTSMFGQYYPPVKKTPAMGQRFIADLDLRPRVFSGIVAD